MSCRESASKEYGPEVKTPKSKVEAKHSGKNNSRKNGAAALATPDCPVKPEGPVVAPDSLVQPRELEFQNPKLDQILSKHQKKWRNS